METPEQLMPPPSTNGATSMSNGHTDGSSAQSTAQGRTQDQQQFDANSQNQAQSISAGIFVFAELRSSAD